MATNKKPDAATIKILKGVAKSFDIEMSSIKTKFTKLLAIRAVQNLQVPSEPERERHAVRILVAELTAERDRKEFSGKVAPVIVRIESKEGISDFKRAGTDESGYRAGMFVTIQDEDENVNVAKLTLWNNGCECHPNLIVGETYATNVVIGNRGDIWECSINDATDVEDSDVVLKPLKDIITEVFTPISIDECENNISKDRDDLKLVSGVVVSSWAKVTTSGRDMGFLKIMSDTDFDTSIVFKFSGDANIVNSVSSGDLVYALGQITSATVAQDGSQEYPIGAWGSLIVPVLVTKPNEDESDEIETPDESEDEENTDETVDSSDGDEEDIEEAIAEW